MGKKEYNRALKRVHETVKHEKDVLLQHEEEKKYLTVNYLRSDDSNKNHDYVKKLQKVAAKIELINQTGWLEIRLINNPKEGLKDIMNFLYYMLYNCSTDDHSETLFNQVASLDWSTVKNK